MSSDLIRKAKVSALAGAPADDSTGVCDHCGDSLAGLRVVRRSLGPTMKSFCCNGCSFIAEQLFLAQAGSKDREALASIVNAGSDETTVVPGGGYAQVQLPIRGMVCSACALLIEHTLRKQPGVARANVDFGAQLAYITFDQRLSRASSCSVRSSAPATTPGASRSTSAACAASNCCGSPSRGSA